MLAAAALSIAACPRDPDPPPATTTRTSSAEIRTETPTEPERVRLTGGRHELEADLLLPAGDGVVPGIVYNHGSEQDPSLHWLGQTARWFQANGFAVLVVYRRGAAGSQGPHWSDRVAALVAEGVDPHDALVRALDEDREDVVTAGRWLAAHRRVDPDRISAAGCSFGGIMAMLAAEHGEPFKTTLDFAGASMSWAGNASLRERLRRAARDARIPVFFLQAQNDFDTSPSLELAAEMDRAGKPHRTRIYDAWGDSPQSGHAGFCNRAQERWGADVLEFLATNGAGPSAR